MDSDKFAYLNGLIINDVGDLLNYKMNHKWSGKSRDYPPEIPMAETGHFKADRLPKENSGPAAAVVYGIQKIDGSEPFHWMFSWMVEGSDGKNKVYSEVRKAGGFGDDWDKIYRLLIASDNQVHAEWPPVNPLFKTDVVIEDVTRHPTLHATVSLIRH